ncbi:MAG: low temperature requirement protein A [Solirubrobacteraceae bacterium]
MAVERDQRVTPLELFFDLVFVFAITQVTTLMAREGGLAGIGHGLLALSAWWWAWVSYSWLTNTFDAEQGRMRLVIFSAAAAMLVAALATPRAFAGDGLLFAVPYAIVRAIHLLLYVIAAPDRGQRRAVGRLAPTTVAGSALLVLAGALSDRGALRDGLWCLALLIDYAGPLRTGVDGWRLQPGHFAERHGLIVLIALGESVVSVGAASGRALDAGVVGAALLATALAGALWWAYFDVVALVAERNLRNLTGVEQNRTARDSYTYLHLLLIAGIVLIALGIKRCLEDTGAQLAAPASGALFGGVALYLVGHVLFRLRNVHSLNRQRVLAAALALALIVPATEVTSLTALGGAALLMCGLIAYEAVRFAEGRKRVRGNAAEALPPS